MSYTVPALGTIHTDILRDISNQLPLADTGTDSDYSVRAAATASALEGLYDHQAWIAKQIFPDTADSDMLTLHARVRGLSYKQAVQAGGTVQLNGAVKSVALSGQMLVRGDGAQYMTTADATTNTDGIAIVTAIAVVAGSTGNANAGTALTLSSPPNGFSSSASVVSMVGGTDIETSGELLARLLDVIRNPPAGGNAYDYRRWAMNVPGVSAAYIYPLRRGLGTVDIVIIASGGLPSATTITAVQTYIDGVRPVTAKNALVLAPTIVTIDHSIAVSLSGILLVAAKQLIQTGLNNYFSGLAPGDPYIRSRAEAIVSELSGVTDRQIITPSANVIPATNAAVVQWCQMGNLIVEPM